MGRRVASPGQVGRTRVTPPDPNDATSCPAESTRATASARGGWRGGGRRGGRGGGGGGASQGPAERAAGPGAPAGVPRPAHPPGRRARDPRHDARERDPVVG